MRGRDPALAQTRESMPFWPILASSWNWTSTSPGETSPGIACLASLLKLRRHSSCDSGSACGWMGRGESRWKPRWRISRCTPSTVSRTPKRDRIRARRSPNVQLQCSPASASGPASSHERSVATCPSSSKDGRPPVRAAPASTARPPLIVAVYPVTQGLGPDPRPAGDFGPGQPAVTPSVCGRCAR